MGCCPDIFLEALRLSKPRGTATFGISPGHPFLKQIPALLRRRVSNLSQTLHFIVRRIMNKKKTPKNALADPTRLQPHDEDDKETIQVIIETPKGSRNKFAFDVDQKVFELKKVLPAGMTFPHDFGFIPSTKAEDGDPVDVLVLMDEPAYPGCLIKCRPVGVIEGEQGKNKKDTERNDRIVATELMNHTYAHVKHVDDLGKNFIKELEEFFINYHELSGKQYRVLDVRGPGEARRRIKDGMRAVKKK
jgi:inorganic pyrophosphatase